MTATQTTGTKPLPKWKRDRAERTYDRANLRHLKRIVRQCERSGDMSWARQADHDLRSAQRCYDARWSDGYEPA